MPAAALSLHQKTAESPEESHPEPKRLPPKERKRWEPRKLSNEDLAGILEQGPNERFWRMAARSWECSDVLVLVEYMNPATGGISYRVHGQKCHVRHCPICQSARAYKLQKQFKEILPVLQERVKNGAFLLLTLTVENCPVDQLRATLADMNKAWQRLVQRQEFKVVRGWMRGTEVTQGKNGPMMAHPHFHALLFVPPGYFSKYYISHARWRELWQECARLDYAPSVDIRRVKTPESGSQEAIKPATYSVKPSDHTDNAQWFYAFHEQVSGLRFLATGGLIKELIGKTQEIGTKDDIEGANEPSAESVPTGESLYFRRKRTDKKDDLLPREKRCYQFSHREIEDDNEPFNSEGTANDHQD